MYLRIYDHGVAHDLAQAGCRWRFEAELKGSVATRYAALLMSKTQRELATAAIVRTLFTDRRIEAPWSAGTLRTTTQQKSTPTMEKRLEWLAKQVRPSIRKLVEDGRIVEVIKALGLEDEVAIKQPKK